MNRRYSIAMFTAIAIAAIAAIAAMVCGSVHIPTSEVLSILTGHTPDKDTWGHIILDLRLPAVITAVLAGMSLAVAGLLMQTIFANPLAGPSIMGVSSGASLGVAVLVLLFGAGTGAVVSGAILGAMAVVVLLVALAGILRSGVMLLIVGILISYLSSSAIILLNYAASEQSVHTYVLWGMGTFSDTSWNQMAVPAAITTIGMCAAVFMAKGLNAMLMGENYAANLGVRVWALRAWALLTAGTLTAVTTAYCGPIAFIGLAVPHIARLALGSTNHHRLLPLTMACGAATALLTLWMCTLPSRWGAVPVNAITPIIGVPVIIYIILNHRRIAYFN